MQVEQLPINHLINVEMMWNAVESRDRLFDGKFFFGVVTTGVYCRPSCGCRLPLRKNVRFFADPGSAEQAGLRPCRRCRPNETAPDAQNAERMRELADYIRSHSQEPLSLNELADRVQLSPFHLQRSFKAVIGVTPKQFTNACRMNAFKNELRQPKQRQTKSVTEAVYETGFGSSSRLYEKVNTHLGMTPAQYRAGGSQLTISYASVDSELGRMMVGATDRGICFIQFAETDEELLRLLAAEYPAAAMEPMARDSEDQFQVWMTRLQQHLAGESPDLRLPLDLRATAFQIKVWRYLQSIPYGGVKSYAEVAAELNQPGAARAVARACAANRIALAIPCHRVIRGNGDLAGYKWGLDRKRTLIDQERRRSSGI